jgi:hypothetical protein
MMRANEIHKLASGADIPWGNWLQAVPCAMPSIFPCSSFKLAWFWMARRAASSNENAMVHELRKAGLAVVQQQGITVRYDGVTVGEYAVDLLIEKESSSN